MKASRRCVADMDAWKIRVLMGEIAAISRRGRDDVNKMTEQEIAAATTDLSGPGRPVR